MVHELRAPAPPPPPKQALWSHVRCFTTRRLSFRSFLYGRWPSMIPIKRHTCVYIYIYIIQYTIYICRIGSHTMHWCEQLCLDTSFDWKTHILWALRTVKTWFLPLIDTSLIRQFQVFGTMPGAPRTSTASPSEKSHSMHGETTLLGVAQVLTLAPHSRGF